MKLSGWSVGLIAACMAGDAASQASERFINAGCETVALIGGAVPQVGRRAYQFNGTCSLSSTGKKAYGTISATFDPATNRATERADLRLIQDPNVRMRVNIVWSCNSDPFLRDNAASCLYVSANSPDLIIPSDGGSTRPLAYQATTMAAVLALNPPPTQQESFDCPATAQVISVHVDANERRYKFSGTCTRRDPNRVFPAVTRVAATWRRATNEAFFLYDFTSGSVYMGSQRYRCDTDPWIEGSPPAMQQCTWLGFTGNTLQVPIIGAGQVTKAQLERATRRGTGRRIQNP